MSRHRAVALPAACLALVLASPVPLGAATLARGLAALARGAEAMSLAKLRHAVRILRELARQDRAPCEVHYHLARAYIGLGLYYEAERDVDRAAASLRQGIAAAEVAVQCGPDRAAYHTVLGDVHGMLAGHSGVIGQIRHGQRAAAAYARAVELDPKSALARVGLGITKLETPAVFGGSTDEALRNFRLARRLDPACAEAWVWEGIALRRREAIPEARAAFVRALEIAPHDRHARRELAELDEDFE